MDCEIVGLRIRCPETLKIVNVERVNFAIGPINSSSRSYRVRCKCGELHTSKTQHVTKPTKQRPAKPVPPTLDTEEK